MVYSTEQIIELAKLHYNNDTCAGIKSVTAKNVEQQVCNQYETSLIVRFEANGCYK